MDSVEVFYEGRVQGVGFRWSVRNVAKGFDVTGWVQNLPDGRVQMQVSGEKEEVDAFLKAIAEASCASHIRKQFDSTLSAPVNAHGIEIRA